MHEGESVGTRVKRCSQFPNVSHWATDWGNTEILYTDESVLISNDSVPISNESVPISNESVPISNKSVLISKTSGTRG